MSDLIDREPCPCGQSHVRLNSVAVGQAVRVRCHWRHYHRTGTVTVVRLGNGSEPICDVMLDAGGSAASPAELVVGLAAWELWEGK